jgi:hypothetical protein
MKIRIRSDRLPMALVTLALLVCLAPATSARAFFKCMPIYGNWCGPGHPSSGYPPPVDAYDAACMRHDLCTLGPGSDTRCDHAFVGEVRTLAAQLGYLPRPLQWAEYVIRVKSGGGWGDMPMPSPWDAMGALSSIAAPCW